MKEALFFEKLEDKKVRCVLCPHNCVIKNGASGACRVRVNNDGILYSKVYAYPDAIHFDPIEKKPLFHFFPGSQTLSIATVGCNFSCKFCQNFDISQRGEPFYNYGEVPPEKVVNLAIEKQVKIISYTYTEPTIYFEYMIECAKLAKKAGIYNVIVSNGYINDEPLEMLLKYIDGGNIDLKFYSDKLYRKYTGGSVKPVLNTIQKMHQANKLVEVTTLLIPGANDNEKELDGITNFIASLSKDIPWHISRFYPTYKMVDREYTPISSLKEAYNIGKQKGLNYIYIGNVPFEGYEDTICPNCNKVVIKRLGYTIFEYNLTNNKCKYCNFEIAGRFETFS